MTAAHLVAGCKAVQVIPEGGGALPAEIRSADAGLDVAELQVSGAAPPSAAVATGLAGPGRQADSAGLCRGRVRRDARPVAVDGDRAADPAAAGAPAAAWAGCTSWNERGDRWWMRGGVSWACCWAGATPAAPGSAALARRIGYPVAEVAVAVPARWLPQPGRGRPSARSRWRGCCAFLASISWA